MPDDTTEDSTEAPVRNLTPDTEEELFPHAEKTSASPDTDAESDTFPRAYVEELRAELKSRRLTEQSAVERADQYAQRLYTELVRATGRLADPTDMPFDAEHLDDADKLTAAIDELLARKPHLASRTPAGDVGQGITGVNKTSVDLAAILRGKAH